MPTCTAANGVSVASCAIDDATGEFIINLIELEEGGEVGNFQVMVDTLVNPPSRRGSSTFPVHDYAPVDGADPVRGVYLTTGAGIEEQIAYYDQEVRIDNDYAAEL